MWLEEDSAQATINNFEPAPNEGLIYASLVLVVVFIIKVKVILTDI